MGSVVSVISVICFLCFGNILIISADIFIYFFDIISILAVKRIVKVV